MEQDRKEIAELKKELEDLSVACEGLEPDSEEYQENIRRQENIEVELGIYEMAKKADNFFGSIKKSIPGIEGLMDALLSKREEIVPQLKSVLLELLGGSKNSEAEKPVEPEMDKETLALYNAVKILLLEGLEDVAIEAMKFKFQHMQTFQITQALEAIRVLLKTGHRKSPMVLFVNLFKKTES